MSEQGTGALKSIGSVTSTATDQAFEILYNAVVSLELPPGTKVSEIEVAKQLGVSRQPIRDAFFRLSKLGFLLMRPQRATLISKISEEAVLRAAFVRTALEVECGREAAVRAAPADLADLDLLIAQQEKAVAAGALWDFHDLDDQFHRRICAMAGQEHAWAVIQEQKGHMDRVRFLSLSFGKQDAVTGHRAIASALANRDPVQVEAEIRAHLGQIRAILAKIRDAQQSYFDDAED
ncbi:GntR family transcriptional regulator [Pseudoruegeria sp. SK021]|uniref:GntR family transcriptional regulator n=1 Tax=Pseudoruegeria sp. SK021 TaxID=1933035 RepID=UPI000A22F672|nr:GntR family transcriptional regulator [Pseudoruegeria sp. SK021]OSP56165.1 GntR family transcriptional regulator [Pseudoruegeria sp. SK021]